MGQNILFSHILLSLKKFLSLVNVFDGMLVLVRQYIMKWGLLNPNNIRVGDSMDC